MDTLKKAAIAKEVGELALRGLCLGSSTFLTFRVLKKAGFAVGIITGTATGVLSMLAVDCIAATAEKIIMGAINPSDDTSDVYDADGQNDESVSTSEKTEDTNFPNNRSED